MGHDRAAFNDWVLNNRTNLGARVVQAAEATVFCVKKAHRNIIGCFDPMLIYYHTHDYALRVIDAGMVTAVAESAVFWHDNHHRTINNQTLFNPDEALANSVAYMDKKWGYRWHW
jgi:GT2 family glycosyltransferase